jgi:hypothetical protein
VAKALLEMADGYLPRRTKAATGGVSSIKEAGLRTLAVMIRALKVDASSPASLGLLKSPVDRIADILCRMDALQLFSDWAPRRELPCLSFSPAPSTAFSSSTRKSDTDSFAASKALDDTQSFWQSEKAAKSVYWGVKFDAEIPLAQFSLELRSQSLPETLEVEIMGGEPRAEWVSVWKKTGKDVLPSISVDFPVSTVVLQIRATFTNFASAPVSNTDNSFSIVKARVMAYVKKDTFTSPAQAVDELRQWLLDTAHAAASSNPTVIALELSTSVYNGALRGLIGLASASGSLRVLLSVCDALLSTDRVELPVDCTASVTALVEAVRQQIFAVRHSIDEREYMGEVKSRVQGGTTWGPLEAVFDPKEASSGVTISNEGKTIKSDNGNYNHCLLNWGSDRGFTEGRASWEFRLVEDTDSQVSKQLSSPAHSCRNGVSLVRLLQCSCFGASIKPVTSSDYNNSPSFFMYRSYNGYRYASGSNIHSSGDTRVFKGDIIKFDLDFDEGDGVIKVTIKGVSKGPLFTGLRGKEIWPAVAFYGSARVVDIVSVEGPTRAGGKPTSSGPGDDQQPASTVGKRSSAFLADLTELHAVAQGSFGKNGDIGYGKDEQRKVKVGGNTVQHSLSLHPPSGRFRGADDEELSPDAKSQISDVSGDERREVLLQRAMEDTRRRFANTGTAVYHTDKLYESFSGNVALNDTATTELRGGADASPVYFEIYGDNVLLWRSGPFHAAKSPPESFLVSLVGVDILRLVTRCVGANTGAHAVWLDPVLLTATEWSSYGWRHGRDVFDHELYGIPRKESLPVPSLEAILPSGAGAQSLKYPTHACNAILNFAGMLAEETLRGMRGAQASSGGFAADPERPFALQVDEPVIVAIHDLCRKFATSAETNGATWTPSLTGLIHLATVNLRHVTTSSASPVDLNIGQLVESSDKDKEKGKGKDKDKKAKTMTVEISKQIESLFFAISQLAEWGGSAAGEPLMTTASAASHASAKLANAELQQAVWEFLDFTHSVIPTKPEDRANLFRKWTSGAGVVEFELTWPCEELGDDGALLQLESVLLQLQLFARTNAWRAKLLGRWPAKVYVVVEVPGDVGVAAFLEGDFANMLSAVDLSPWWQGLSGAEGVSLKLERDPKWDRRSRIRVEPGFGVVRAYPGNVCSYEDVMAGIRSFVPVNNS